MLDRSSDDDVPTSDPGRRLGVARHRSGFARARPQAASCKTWRPVGSTPGIGASRALGILHVCLRVAGASQRCRLRWGSSSSGSSCSSGRGSGCGPWSPTGTPTRQRGGGTTHCLVLRRRSCPPWFSAQSPASSSGRLCAGARNSWKASHPARLSISTRVGERRVQPGADSARRDLVGGHGAD